MIQCYLERDGVVYVWLELASFMMNACWLMSVYGSLRTQKHLSG